ncbi:MAG: uridine kinase [Spirochaetia bacterium]
MKGDKIVVEAHHYSAAAKIVPSILAAVKNKQSRYIITVAGESGSGKSETGTAIAETLEKEEINCVVLGQDDYFVYPPKTNDQQRRKDPDWLGPMEVKLDLLNDHLKTAIQGTDSLKKPLMDYDKDALEEETISLEGVKVIIAEGTYTSLLKYVDTKVFISRNRLDTLEHRKKRNRGNEVGDPFVEEVLKTEHKIIMGHKHLADFVITKDYEVVEVEQV